MKPHRTERSLLVILIISALFSALVLWCAEPMMNSALKNSHLWIKQLFWNLFGALCFLILNHLDPYRIPQCIRILRSILMIFLFLLLIDKFFYDLPDTFIRSINGTTSWIQIPKLGSFQPSEFMKIILIVQTGFIIHDHFESISISSYQTDFKLFLKVLRILLLPLILMIVQPDTGIPIVILVSVLMMLLTSPIKRIWIILTLLLILSVFTGIILFYQLNPETFHSMSGYRLQRISGWLNPEKTMKNEGYQLYTSLLMISGCGISGCGLRSFMIHVPEAHTDFIYTLTAQNFGLAGTLILICLSLSIDFILMSIIQKSPDSPLKTSVFGLFVMIAFQQIQNISMTIGLLPVTGIPLPFFSYGGSSLISTWSSLSLCVILSKSMKSHGK